MSVNVLRIDLIGDNPTQLMKPFIFQITLDCVQPLADDLEWRLTYVGSAESEKHDQLLDSIMVGPLAVGMSKFILESPGPNPSLIPTKDLIGITCVLLTGLYQNKEFIRVGYFVNNEFDIPEMNLAPPANPDYSRLIRSILTEKPRVTRYPIDWSGEATDVLHSDMSNGSSMSREDSMQVEEVSYGAEDKGSPFEIDSNGCDFVPILQDKLSLKIFQYLDEYSLASGTAVSRLWMKTIQQGVNWKNVDLSQIDWGAYNPTEKQRLINFVIHHSSQQLEELTLSYCDGIDDQTLGQWLTKCGSSLRHLDISWCVSLTPKVIYHITQLAPALETLRVCRYPDTEFAGTSKASLEDNIPHVQEICSRYKGRLEDLQFSGLPDVCITLIADALGSSLKSLSIPYSVVSEQALVAALSRCPRLEDLGLQFVNISADLLSKLRGKFRVHGSHVPSDFSIELSSGDEDDTIVLPSLKDWPSDVDVTEVIKKLLPEGFSNHTEEIRFRGEPKDVANILSNAGFDDITIKDDDEDIQDELAVCGSCGETSMEEDLLVCDECEVGYHPECVDHDPGNQMDVPDLWLCPDCSRTERIEDDVELPTKKKQKL